MGPYDEDTAYHPTTSAGSVPQLPPHRDPFRDRDPSPYRVHNPIPAGSSLNVAGDPFRDDLALSHDHGEYGSGSAGGGGGRVDFPSGNYGNVGVFEREGPK